MRRRTVLGLLAGGGVSSLAGCTATREQSAGESVALVSASCEEPRIALDAELTDGDLQGDRPPSFSLALTWSGERRRLFSFGNRIPFSFPKYSTERRVVLLPPDRGYERRTVQGWVPETDGDELSAPQNLLQWELRPGEMVSRAWNVWANPETEGYLGVGDHQFEFTFGASQPETNSLTDVEASLSVRIE